MVDVDDKYRNLPKVRGVYKYNEPLCNYTWLHAGGAADVLFLPADETDLSVFLKAKMADIPVFILGGGSNILVRDGGLQGVTVKLSNKTFSDYRLENGLLYVGAGMQNFALRKILEKHELGGLEFICSIPGSIGGMLRSNAGCFGSDAATVLHAARIMDKQGQIFNIPCADFHFCYRCSDFPDEWIILGVYLKYQSSTAQQISEIIEKNALYRKTHQPQKVRTAGSTFKNPEGYAAWKLIKEAGADTLQVGGARMSEVHCNFLVNDGTATASDIETLIHLVQQRVSEHCGVELLPEVKIVGRK